MLVGSQGRLELSICPVPIQKRDQMVPTFTGIGYMFGLPAWSSHYCSKIVVGMLPAPKAVASSPSKDACQLLLTNSKSPSYMLPSTQGCPNGRFWMKMSVRTSFLSGRPRMSSGRPPASAFTRGRGSARARDRVDARKHLSHGHGPVRTGGRIRAVTSPPLPPLPPSPLLSARMRKNK
jgi:hypothetical protein